jgi:hypothetical protein
MSIPLPEPSGVSNDGSSTGLSSAERSIGFDEVTRLFCSTPFRRVLISMAVFALNVNLYLELVFCCWSCRFLEPSC